MAHPPARRSPPAPLPPFAAVLAGGESRRFGSPKALARVGGARVIDRVAAAARDALGEVVLIANQPEMFYLLDLPVRPDAVPGAGALGGVHAALRWAADEGRAGALCIACDMPFLAPGLLRRLADRAAEGSADAVVPESTGRRGIEPLCAFYSVTCLAEAERMLRDGERRLVDLLERVRTVRLPLQEVRLWGEPEVLFLNVNTPADHTRAEEIARSGKEHDAMR
ncbi:MAG TPA: molybdenum cofactor guanylyltransferase [Longimicrobiaceae bacterium]|nr:molybdenum cofactor guanylyltransferase [Longimicrobiaceae bacterium]